MGDLTNGVAGIYESAVDHQREGISVRNDRSTLRYRLPIVAFACAFGLAVLPMPAAIGGVVPTVTVIASGLNNPRGLSATDAQSFFVAEAGKGGSGRCGPGPLGKMCAGRTGRVTHIEAGVLDRLVRLSSIALPDGTQAFGPHDVAASDNGALFATLGLGGDLETRDGFGRAGSQLGTLVKVTPDGRTRVVADLLAYEASHDPNEDGIESDPYGILRVGKRTIVTDAAGNSLLRVSPTGRIKTLAVFPNRDVEFEGDQVTMDSVPTSVVVGPDGAYYVSELTGFPFPVGEARVYRVVPGEDPEIYATGFTNVIDIAFDSSGNLWVVEIAHNSLAAAAPFGALLRVGPGGGGTPTVVLQEGLSFPTSVAIADDGSILVTNCGVCPGDGEVLKVVP
jgi:hypothetical protein